MSKLFLFLFSILAITSCNKEEDLSVKGITLSKSSLTIKPDVTETLSYTIFPENAKNKNVSWSSSNEAIVTVSQTGVVKGISPGLAVVKVTTQEGNEIASCAVTVSLNDPVTVSGNVEGVWKKFSVINVSGHIIIPANKTLTIEEGVEVIVSTSAQDANNTKIEWIIHGNLYCLGTTTAPVKISVPASDRTTANTFKRLWGGIIGSTTCTEILLDNTIIEYTGAITTATSPSVVAGLFKAGGGEGMVAFNTNNPSGKYVIVNSTFRSTGEDAIYVQGGSCIFSHNLFYALGEAGGEAINVKAGCKVDAGFNIMYSPNTNALKLSNSGSSATRSQAQIIAYNNTIVNAGWRRDPNKPKGGSVWGEAGCLITVYNNLIVNSMFRTKAPDWGKSATTGPDLSSKIDFNFFASGTQQSSVSQHVANGTLTAFDGFKPGIKDAVYGPNDVSGSAPGDKDPKFVNFPFNTDPLLSYNYNPSWDFHLDAGSPALTGGYTNFTPYFSGQGLTLNGKTYVSPTPKSYFGALGSK
ncbi:MAG: Ig-like domain-containing protein [Saprospiraceae bacterium]|nr:Ig-like domain-containing protein [Saprospiraceae bacterium]